MNYLFFGLLGAVLAMAGCGSNQVTSPVPVGPGVVEMSQVVGPQVEVSGMQSQMGQSLHQQKGQAMGPSTAYTTPAQFTSNGQRIYFTATSNSGAPISFTMGHHSTAMPCLGTA